MKERDGKKRVEKRLEKAAKKKPAKKRPERKRPEEKRPEKKRPEKKRPEKKRQGSLLTRFFKRGEQPDAKRPAAKRPPAAADSPTPSSPLTPLERSIAEIKQMVRIGQKDPERLALMLTNLLGEERQRRDLENARHRRLIEEIARRRDGTP